MLSPRSFLVSRNRPTSSSSATPNTNPQCNLKPSIVTSKTNKKHNAKTGHNKADKQRDSSDMSVSVMTMHDKSSPSAPLVIPIRLQHEPPSQVFGAIDQRIDPNDHYRHANKHTYSRTSKIHSPDAIPPSVAALLAMTAIPQRKRNTTRKITTPSQRLTVDAVLRHTRRHESEYSLSMSRSPVDILLNTSDDDGDLDTVGSDPENESFMSLRSMSVESMPSLVESSTYDSSLSLPSLLTPSPGASPIRKRRLPSVSSPTRQNTLEHPLSDNEGVDVDSLDFSAFAKATGDCEQEGSILEIRPSRRSAFKSNLTASLKALKAAAISFSSMTTPMLTPDDFLTRSIITIDPRVPFTDERMPPKLADIPTPALRRYLNPTSHRTPDLQTLMPGSSKCTASIQMQTYKIHKDSDKQNTKLSKRKSLDTACTEPTTESIANPVIRQREMRENSDFIRIAVMEMLMRKNGKLDDKVPGHAKWALPPRQASPQVCQVGEGGVPVRWIAITA